MGATISGAFLICHLALLPILRIRDSTYEFWGYRTIQYLAISSVDGYVKQCGNLVHWWWECTLIGTSFWKTVGQKFLWWKSCLPYEPEIRNLGTYIEKSVHVYNNKTNQKNYAQNVYGSYVMIAWTTIM